MKTGFQIQIHSKIPELLADLQPKLDAAVRRTAFAVQESAQINTTRVDTSAMRQGWSVQTKRQSDYASVIARVSSINPKGKTFSEKAVEKVCEAWVVNVMMYAIWHEFGTRRFSATPMLGPALEAHQDTLAKQVTEVLRG
jgi:hypothetical protein